jgi:hypothetical protein
MVVAGPRRWEPRGPWDLPETRCWTRRSAAPGLRTGAFRDVRATPLRRHGRRARAHRPDRSVLHGRRGGPGCRTSSGTAPHDPAPCSDPAPAAGLPASDVRRTEQTLRCPDTGGGTPEGREAAETVARQRVPRIGHGSARRLPHPAHRRPGPALGSNGRAAGCLATLKVHGRAADLLLVKYPSKRHPGREAGPQSQGSPRDSLAAERSAAHAAAKHPCSSAGTVPYPRRVGSSALYASNPGRDSRGIPPHRPLTPHWPCTAGRTLCSV